MIKHFNIFVLLLMTLIASSGMAQNPNTPKHFLMPRELPYFEKQTKKDFIMFGFIQAGSENAGGILHHVAAGLSGCR